MFEAASPDGLDEAIEFFEGLEADNIQGSTGRLARRCTSGRSGRRWNCCWPSWRLSSVPFKIMRPSPRYPLQAPTRRRTRPTSAPVLTWGRAGVYVSFSGDGLYVGAGTWHMSRDQLVRYRAAVDGDGGAELESIGADLAKVGFEARGRDAEASAQGMGLRPSPSEAVAAHVGPRSGRHHPPAPWMAGPPRPRTEWSRCGEPPGRSTPGWTPTSARRSHRRPEPSAACARLAGPARPGQWGRRPAPGPHQRRRPAP